MVASRYLPATSGAEIVASKRSSAKPSATAETQPMPPAGDGDSLARWLAQGIEEGVKPEQALSLIGLGLMRRMVAAGQDPAWAWSEEEDGGRADLSLLRQRLELTQLALQTGAPLSTSEVTQLMGARPGSPVVERGGLTARRLSRNVWKLSRSSDEPERGGYGFSEGFRRRL
jgi:hypothetical protein